MSNTKLFTLNIVHVYQFVYQGFTHKNCIGEKIRLKYSYSKAIALLSFHLLRKIGVFFAFLHFTLCNCVTN